MAPTYVARCAPRRCLIQQASTTAATPSPRGGAAASSRRSIGDGSEPTTTRMGRRMSLWTTCVVPLGSAPSLASLLFAGFSRNALVRPQADHVGFLVVVLVGVGATEISGKHRVGRLLALWHFGPGAGTTCLARAPRPDGPAELRPPRQSTAAAICSARETALVEDRSLRSMWNSRSEDSVVADRRPRGLRRTRRRDLRPPRSVGHPKSFLGETCQMSEPPGGKAALTWRLSSKPGPRARTVWRFACSARRREAVLTLAHGAYAKRPSRAASGALDARPSEPA